MRLLFVAFTLVLAAPAAEAASCRDDQLGSVLCREFVRPEPRPLTGRAAPEPRRSPSPLIPAWRENAFGRIAPEREGSEARGFRAPLAVGDDRLICGRSTLGNVRCR